MSEENPPMKALGFVRRRPREMLLRARAFRESMTARRSVRHFSPDPIPRSVLEECVRAAGQAPSGANKQPWRFVVVTDPERKRRIRAAAEEEERAFYGGRAPDTWLQDLVPFGTDADKPFLELAPALVVIFAQKHGPNQEKHYYVNESVGLAVGFFLAACAEAGLATLTHTPSPMGFLGEVLERPAFERPYLLVPVGYPAQEAEVPDITKKPLGDILEWYGSGAEEQGAK